MTTHYQKIQALGNRMAENLTIMGVPSQFDEGGLTLADKILEISSGITTGLLLYGDKKVAQSGDTVNLSMMVLEDGEFKPNTNVILHETILDKTYSTHSSISKSIGDNWVIEGPFENIISSSDTSGTTITAWGNGYLTINVNGNQVYHDSEAGSISKISYINKILSYNNKTVDLTEYNASFNVLSNVKAGRIIVKTAYVLTTDTHGLATHAYTCSGSGLKEFYATSGTFVSETYSLTDCVFYYDGTTTVPSRLRYSSQSAVLTPTQNGINILNNHSTSTIYVGIDKEGTSSTISNWIDWVDFGFEFEYVESTNEVLFQLRYDHSDVYQYPLQNLSQGDIFRVEYTNGVTKTYKNGTQIGTDHASDVGELTGIRWSLNASKSMTIKNIKLYPI